MTKSQQKRALELLRQCMACGTIAKAYIGKPACLGDEIEVFLEKVKGQVITKSQQQTRST